MKRSITMPGGRLGARCTGLIRRLAYVPWSYRLARAACPGWIAGWSALLVVQGLLPVAAIWLTRSLVNGLVHAVRAGFSWETAGPTVLVGALMAGVLLLSQWLQSVMELVRTSVSELVQDHVTAMIHRKAAAVDVAFYESPEYHDLSNRACGEAAPRVISVLESGGVLAQTSFTLLGLAGVLLSYAWWLPLALAASALPTLYAATAGSRRYHGWWERTTSIRRRIQYYHSLLTGDFAACELRLFDLSSHLQSEYQGLRREQLRERLRLTGRQCLERLIGAFASLVISAGALGLIFWRSVTGTASLGDVALFYGVFSSGQDLMRSLFGGLNQLYSSSLVLDDFSRFLALEAEVVEPERPHPAPEVLRHGIRLRQVGFRYPGSARAALEGFDLTIPAGKIVAVVGPNGAGKSTLARLLCRFFDPESGSVEFDGIDIRKLSLRELRRMITAQFQFPVYYHATVSENIRISDLEGRHEPEEIRAAARAAGADEVVQRLPQGYDTFLGKWFLLGEDLSAGEWQRLALARAFLRNSPVMILDEPTSFMDSWSEADWFDRFATLAAGRTAVIITHRFSIAMRADVICVMESGKIVESGSHEELLSRGGAYCRAWNSQVNHADVSHDPTSPTYGFESREPLRA